MTIDIKRTILKNTLMLSLGAVAALTACGHQDEGRKSPDPSVFAQGNPSVTKWTLTIEASQTDPATQQPLPQSRKHIDVIYEFQSPTAGAKWRRIMRIASEDGSVQSMFQSGEISEMTGDKMTIAVSRSSCDDASGIRTVPGAQLLYYRSQPSLLRLDTTPLPAPASNIAEFFGQVMTKPIAEMFRLGLEQAFSFGSARAFLTSGHGDFKLNNAFPTDAAHLGTIGCFAISGRNFEASSLRPDW